VKWKDERAMAGASATSFADAEARIDAVIRELALKERRRRRSEAANGGNEATSTEGTFYARPLVAGPDLLPVVSPLDVIER